MPYEDPDPTDPMTLNGVVFETNSDHAMREMAACFIDEYLRLGFGCERIMKLFQTRSYAGPHMAYRSLGEDAIQKLIDEAAQCWGPRLDRRPVDRDHEGNVRLTVLGRRRN